MLIDEFALRTGHRYSTVMMDGLRKHVLWVGKGRGREDYLRPFLGISASLAGLPLRMPS